MIFSGKKQAGSPLEGQPIGIEPQQECGIASKDSKKGIDLIVSIDIIASCILNPARFG